MPQSTSGRQRLRLEEATHKVGFARPAERPRNRLPARHHTATPQSSGTRHHCQDNRSSEKAHSTEKHNPCFLVLTCAKVLLERGVNSLENQPDGSRRDS